MLKEVELNPVHALKSRTNNYRTKHWTKKEKNALTVYVGVLREACPPPELLLEMREAACVTSP
jgi:hypothetical protein